MVQSVFIQVPLDFSILSEPPRDTEQVTRLCKSTERYSPRCWPVFSPVHAVNILVLGTM